MSCHGLDSFGFAAIIVAFMSPLIVSIWASAKYGEKNSPESETDDHPPA